MTLSPTTRGILAMVGTSFLLIINDSLIKVVSDDLATGQIIVIRGLFATLGIGAFAAATGGFRRPAAALSRPVMLRGICEALAAITYLIALFNMPIANVTSIFQVTPLAITATGAIFLGERVGWRRWTAVAVGFLGVMIIARPDTDGFNVYTLLILACVVTVVVRDLATRSIPRSVPSSLVTTVSAFLVMLSGFTLYPFETWGPLDARSLGLLALASFFLVTAYMLMILAVRGTPLSTVAPFRYSSIPFAIAAGYIVWGDVPDMVTLVGIAIIVASGLYSFHRERKVRLEARAPAPPPYPMAAPIR